MCARSTHPSCATPVRFALFTIGETPWSAEQRSAILDAVRAGTMSVLSIHSATDSCYGWDDYGALVGARFDGHPWTQTFTADVLDSSHPRVRISAPSGSGTTRCTSSAICAPTRRCCCACVTASSISARRARGRRRSAIRSRGVSARVRARVLDQSRALPGRGRPRPTSGTWPAASNGRSARRDTRNFSNWAYWRLRHESSVDADPCPLDDPAQIDAWRVRVRDRVVAMLGPSPEPVPLDLEVTETVDCGTYRRERVVFDTEATMSVPAYLLVPHDRVEPGPALLAIHGHGPGKARICGVTEEEHDEGPAYAHVLASEGYVVLAPDLRGFGERTDWMPDDKYHCDWDLVCATMAGVVPHARNLWDLQRSLDVLAAHPLVDPNRMAAGGLSYGATCTLFLAAIDERVRRDRGVLPLVVARRAHGSVEHVRLADPARPDRRDRASRHRGAHRAASAARGERHRRHPLPGRRGARRSSRCGRSTRMLAHLPRRWCTTSSTAVTAGTAPRHRTSWSAGYEYRRPARGARPHVAGSVPAARSARRGRCARRPDAHLGSAPARPRGRARASGCARSRPHGRAGRGSGALVR